MNLFSCLKENPVLSLLGSAVHHSMIMSVSVLCFLIQAPNPMLPEQSLAGPQFMPSCLAFSVTSHPDDFSFHDTFCLSLGYCSYTGFWLLSLNYLVLFLICKWKFSLLISRFIFSSNNYCNLLPYVPVFLIITWFR